MTDEADLAYLRNINTRPGMHAGQSIDPTKPGPTADRIAELERALEIERINMWHYSKSVQFRKEAEYKIDRIRAELSRLRNEPSDAQPAGCELNELAIAQAIEGPRNPVPDDCKWSLQELRTQKWAMLSHQQQKERLWQARAVIALLTTAPHRPDASGLIEAAEWHEEQAAKFAASDYHTDKMRGLMHKEDARKLRARAADRSAT